MIGILIPYTVQFFIKDLTPQKFILLALFPIALGFLIFQKITGKYAELFLTAYMIAVIAILTTAYQDLLPQLNQNESFYTGYSFAMITRLLGYNIVSLKCSILIYLVQIPLKFSLVRTSDALQIIIVLGLDLVTLGLSLKSEIMERDLFDMLYKMKKSVLKFKHLLTQYLPNQIAIFAHDCSKAYYMNNAFRRTFRIPSLNLFHGVLEKLFLEPDAIEKHQTLLKHLGFQNLEDRNLTMTLSTFLNALSQNIDVLRDLGFISFSIIEEEKYDLWDISPKNRFVRNISFDAGIQETNENMINHNMDGKYIDRRTKLDDDEIIGQDEGKRVFRVKIFPLIWDDEEALCIVMEDITSQREIMEMKVADKYQDLMIAKVSHELRTPLNGMLDLLDIARKNIKEPETLKYLKACRNTGMLMLNLVNSILDINQIKSKKLRLVYSKFSLANFLYEIKNLFDHLCEMRRLDFKIEVDVNVPKMITTDKNRLSEILLNLLGNAFKFTFSGGVTLGVSLVCGKSNTRIRFSVRDTGIGIKKEDQERLLGNLKQQGWKIINQGAGFGLTISNTLAELLNPTEKQGLCVESEVDVGTCFSFIVESQNDPKDDEEEVFEEVNEERDRTFLRKMNPYRNIYDDNFSKMTNLNVNHEDSTENENENPWCLVVDDNPFNLMVACHIVEEKGFQVKTALNGKEAVEKFQGHVAKGLAFMLVLMDCQMPVMDGYEATKVLKELMKKGELHECPIVALTAVNRSKEHEDLCQSVGMNGHLSKPLQIEDLNSMLIKIEKIKGKGKKKGYLIQE